MTSRLLRWLCLALAAVLLVRLLTLGLYPLMGTTEPRYAEISRKMLELGDWVTPWYDHGVPFWGKPPLSFWGSAFTMAMFGVNEFAARLGPYLATVACLALLWAWPSSAAADPHAQSDLQPTSRPALPIMAALVCLTSLAGFVSAGAVMTDMFMALGTTLCMLAFWRSVNQASGRSPWRWWFFVGIALGLLAKGPVATVLTGIALVLWFLAAAWQTGQWRALCWQVWQRLPWCWGTLLAALLTLPWYLLAEHRTPGFLNYFIIGEHIQRFLVKGWTGDLYGAGHPEARGTILWFAFLGWLPWPVLALFWAGLLAWARRQGAGARFAQVDAEATAAKANAPSLVASATLAAPSRSELTYLLAWVAAPLLFFTIASNILPSYILPGLPAFGLLMAYMALRSLQTAFKRLWLASMAFGVLLVPLTACVGLYVYPGFMNDRSQRDLLSHWQLGTPLVYLQGRPLSADFYSRGQAVLADKPADIQALLTGSGQQNGQPISLVLERPVYDALPPADRAAWHAVAEHAGYLLLRR